MKSSTLLAKTLARLMEEQKITAKALAAKAKVPRSTLGGWLAGIQPQNLEEVRKVAHALGVTFEHAVFGEEDHDLSRALNGAAREIVLDGYYHVRLLKIESGKEKVDAAKGEKRTR